MSSISSYLISEVTNYRNPNGSTLVWPDPSTRKSANPLKVVLAEVGFLAIIPFAAVEATFSGLAKLFSTILPIGEKNHEAIARWQRSSSFSLLWSIINPVNNLVLNDMVIDEEAANNLAMNRQLLESLTRCGEVFRTRT